MDKETAHKLLDLVLSSNYEGASIKFEPPCGRGYNCSIFIHKWEGDDIVSTKSYHLLRNVWWGKNNEAHSTEEIMEVLEGLQDAEH